MNKKERDPYWDVVKGIGIFSIVIGHIATGTLHNFVYTYHLAIFYFVATYFYKEEIYGDKPYKYFGNRLRGVWFKFVIYCWLVIFFHNFFVRHNFFVGIPPYGINEYLVEFLNTLLLNHSELFLSAVWFISTLVIANGLFAVIIFTSRRISKAFLGSRKIKYLSIIAATAICGITGVYLTANQLELEYHSHTVFLILPICVLGYLYRILIKNTSFTRKISNWYISLPICLISFLFLLFTAKKGWQIELAKGLIINGYMFYIVTAVGIAFCLSLAQLLVKIPIIKQIFSILGKHSFSIMALHFVAIKSVDVIYSYLINETNPEIIGNWITSYPDRLFMVYLIAGTVFPVIFSIIFDYINENIIDKIVKFNKKYYLTEKAGETNEK